MSGDAADELWNAAYDGDLARVDQLLSGPDAVDPNAPNDSGSTPLYAACQQGHAAVVSRLLQCPGVNVNQDVDAITPLFIACYNGFAPVVRALLTHPEIDVCRPRVAADGGESPLTIAAYNGNKPIVEALLAHPKIDVMYRDALGSTAYQWAVKKQFDAIADLLRRRDQDHGADVRGGITTPGSGADPHRWSTNKKVLTCVRTLTGTNLLALDLYNPERVEFDEMAQQFAADPPPPLAFTTAVELVVEKPTKEGQQPERVERTRKLVLQIDIAAIAVFFRSVNLKMDSTIVLIVNDYTQNDKMWRKAMDIPESHKLLFLPLADKTSRSLTIRYCTLPSPKGLRVFKTSISWFLKEHVRGEENVVLIRRLDPAEATFAGALKEINPESLEPNSPRLVFNDFPRRTCVVQ